MSPKDSIRRACVARMKELGLTTYALAKACDGEVSEWHLGQFLAGERDLGSSRLAVVLHALKLKITPDE